jgi:uncharacterized protein (TIGR03437 family)
MAVTWGQPFDFFYIDRPLNAASYVRRGLPNSGIAPGSMFVLKGMGIGPKEMQVTSGFPLRSELAGTSVRVTVAGETVDALMIYTSYSQVAAILPSATPTGAGFVLLKYQGRTSGSRPIQVVRSSFGIFTRNQAGTGPGIIQNVISETDRPVNDLTRVARPSQVAILWGTGLGPVTGDEAAGPLPGDLDASVDVFVGGKPVKVIYKGRSGCCAGIDQIVFEVPQSVEGCYVPVAVRAGGVVSNFATMSIASTATLCSDPPGFSGPPVEKLLRGEPVNLGEIALVRFGIKLDVPGLAAEAKLDFAQGRFARYRADQLLASQSARSMVLAGAPSPGYCVVLPYDSVDYEIPLFPLDEPIQPQFLQAGPALNLTGPSGSKRLTPINHYQWYTGLLGGWLPGVSDPPLTEYLAPGIYTLDNGDGGQDVGAFKATLTVPRPMAWTNQDSLREIRRDQDLTLLWNSSDPDREMVTVYALSGDDPNALPAALLCTERAKAGRFTIPSWVLSALPKSVTEDGIPSGILGLASMSADSEGRFSAPGLDMGRFDYVIVQLKVVEFR